MASQLMEPQMDWYADLRFRRSGSSGSRSGMESMGQPKRNEVMRGTRLQSSIPEREAVCLANACWET